MCLGSSHAHAKNQGCLKSNSWDNGPWSLLYMGAVIHRGKSKVKVWSVIQYTLQYTLIHKERDTQIFFQPVIHGAVIHRWKSKVKLFKVIQYTVIHTMGETPKIFPCCDTQSCDTQGVDGRHCGVTPERRCAWASTRLSVVAPVRRRAWVSRLSRDTQVWALNIGYIHRRGTRPTRDGLAPLQCR